MREQISGRQLVFMLTVMRTTIVIAYLPVLTSADALQDAWISALIAFLGTAALVTLIAGLGARYPQKTVIEYAQDLLGPVLGRLLSLVYLWAFLHLAAIDLRIYSEVLITGFLPETPISFIASLMVLAAALGVIAGIEVVGRVADMVFPMFLLFIVLSLAGPMVDFRPEFLQPVLARGVMPAVRGSLTPVAVAAQFLVLTVLIPHTDEPRGAIRPALIAVVIASVILIVAAVVVIGVMSAPLGAESIFPVFRMVRGVQVSEFIERIEALATFAWGFGLFVSLSVFLFCGARGLTSLLSLNDYRPLVLPMAVIWAALSIHAFDNMFQIQEFLSPRVMGIYGVGLVLVPQTVLWLAHIVRGLRGQPEGDESR